MSSFSNLFNEEALPNSKIFEKEDKKLLRWVRFKYDNNISFLGPSAYDIPANYRKFKSIIDTTCKMWRSWKPSGELIQTANNRRPSLETRWYLINLPDSKHNMEIDIRDIISLIDIQIKDKGDGAPYLDENIFEDRQSNGQVLGYEVRQDYYGTYSPGDGKTKPIITLYYGRIERDYKDTATDVASIVLIHELSHALMDPFNYYDFRKKKSLKIGYNSPFGYAKEESLANAFTLRLVASYKSKKLYERAKDFMMLQPLTYRYGLMISANYLDILLWIKQKVNGCSGQMRAQWMSKYLSYKNEYSYHAAIKGTGLNFCIGSIQTINEVKRILKRAGTDNNTIESIFKASRMKVDKHLRISIDGVNGYLELPPKQKPLYLLLLSKKGPINSMDLYKYFKELKGYYSRFSDKEEVDVTIYGLINDDKSWAKNTINKCIEKFLDEADNTFNYLIQTETCSDHTKKYWIPAALDGKVDFE